MKIVEWVVFDKTIAQNFYTYLKSLNASFTLRHYSVNGFRFWIDVTHDGKVIKTK